MYNIYTSLFTIKSSQVLFANQDYSQVFFPNMPQGCYQVTMFLQVLFSSGQQC